MPRGVHLRRPLTRRERGVRLLEITGYTSTEPGEFYRIKSMGILILDGPAKGRMDGIGL